MKQKEGQSLEKTDKTNISRFYCKKCDVNCKTKYHYNRHLKTRKHFDKHYLSQFNGKGGCCFSCKKTFDTRSELSRHLKTEHFKKKETAVTTNVSNLFQNVSNVSNLSKDPLTCKFCFKKFNSRTTCWRHRKNCKHNNVLQNVEEKTKDVHLQLKIYEELVKMNSKSSEKTVNQTINNNQKISINVFLDKYCGNAMSLQDFAEKLNVTLEDLDATHKLGYVNGMSSIFIKNLKDLPSVERPIHCCDSKRGKFYIKDENKWEKETGDKIEKVIDSLQIKHIKTIKEWEKAHPNYLKDEKLLLKWNDMIHNIMGPYQTEERNKNKKIIVKNVGDEVSIKEAMKNIDNKKI